MDTMEETTDELTSDLFNQTLTTSYNEFINTTEIIRNATLAVNRPASIGLFYWITIKILNWLNFYYLGTILVVGVLGNAFNFCKFLLTRNKLQSPNYYLATLALSDSIFLFTILTVWMGHFDIKFFLKPWIYYILAYFSSVSSCMSGMYSL